jgi:HNH endonuclease
MPTYTRIPDYRKIYEKHHGPIPVDADGRKYHIHHIDGNRRNNDVSNLIALSAEEHLDLHLRQGDWAAALKLASLLKRPADEISAIARVTQLKRMEDGVHPFTSKMAASRNRRLIEEGRYHMLGGDIQRTVARARIDAGTHNFQDREKVIAHHQRRFADGTHQNLKPRSCHVCGRMGKGPGFMNHIRACERKSNNES